MPGKGQAAFGLRPAGHAPGTRRVWHGSCWHAT